jgi:NADH-quinone oxidoreductase subunit G
LRAFSEVVGQKLPYDDLAQVRARLEQVNPAFARLDVLPRFGAGDLTGPESGGVALDTAAFAPAVADYWGTDPISRASPTMAACRDAIGPALAQAAE